MALTTFSELVAEARERVLSDALSAGLPTDGSRLADGGSGAPAYADAVATYLAFAVDKLTDTNSVLCTWQNDPPRLRATFGRQALPMTWDYAEANPWGEAAGDLHLALGSLTEVLDRWCGTTPAVVEQRDAQMIDPRPPKMISTDPPYYDNIGYADLSDYFYVWLRKSIGSLYPGLFETVERPKELSWSHRHTASSGDSKAAQRHFEVGLGAAFRSARDAAAIGYPITVFYAYKQSEASEGAGDGHAVVASTGWETMLEALLSAGLSVTGTWPLRSELATRNIGRDQNALASSIVLACRPRSPEAPLATLGEFRSALATELPAALSKLQEANIAPVDFEQAAIGPGMAVFSRYSGVLDQASGGRIPVRRALEMINGELDTFLTAEHGDLDRDTRWCHTWYRNHGFGEGDYGSAETLAKARNVSVDGLHDAGVLASRAGKVRLLRPNELDTSWDPLSDERLTVWECTHQPDPSSPGSPWRRGRGRSSRCADGRGAGGRG